VARGGLLAGTRLQRCWYNVAVGLPFSDIFQLDSGERIPRVFGGFRVVSSVALHAASLVVASLTSAGVERSINNHHWLAMQDLCMSGIRHRFDVLVERLLTHA
jgi:hypothetical protein